MSHKDFYCLVLRIGPGDFLVARSEYAICQYTFGKFKVYISLDPKHAVWFDDSDKALKTRDLLNAGFKPGGHYEPRFHVIDKETVLKEFRNEEE